MSGLFITSSTGLINLPLKPEDDPAYPYLRASRYSLYVFGDAQSRLFLGQPKEADKALIAMQKETNDPQIEPITKLDMLYYQADSAGRNRAKQHDPNRGGNAGKRSWISVVL